MLRQQEWLASVALPAHPLALVVYTRVVREREAAPLHGDWQVLARWFAIRTWFSRTVNPLDWPWVLPWWARVKTWLPLILVQTGPSSSHIDGAKTNADALFDQRDAYTMMRIDLLAIHDWLIDTYLLLLHRSWRRGLLRCKGTEWHGIWTSPTDPSMLTLHSSTSSVRASTPSHTVVGLSKEWLLLLLLLLLSILLVAHITSKPVAKPNAIITGELHGEVQQLRHDNNYNNNSNDEDNKEGGRK
jgi:hypothetical protein